MTTKWDEFSNDPTYRIEDLGRPAVFLIPSHSLRKKIEGETVEELLHLFLYKQFGAFTTTMLPYFGLWRDGKERKIHDECRQYEVSFVGKERIPELLRYLAIICRAIEEDCLYFKAGQYSCLLYPTDKTPQQSQLMLRSS